MPVSERARTFLEESRAAAMITLRRDGTAHAVRVGIAVVEGKIWSSGTADRVRTRHVRRDPRATLFVIGPGYGALTLESNVRILEGADAPELSVKLFTAMQRRMAPPAAAGHLMWFGKQLSREEFLRTMVEERRLIYEFEVIREYGLQ